MTIALADLRDRVAQRLRILGEGAELEGSDATLIENAITELHEELMARGWAQWNLTAIPEHAVRPLVNILAEELCGEFGLPANERELLARQRAVAVGRLQALAAAEETTGEPVPAEYY